MNPPRTITLALASMLLCASLGQAQGVTVLDGDTVRLSDGEVIRMWGIDAPEKDQTGGIEAKDWLATEIAKGELRVVRKGKDKYGRTIGLLYLGRRSLNKAIVIEGLAFAYREYSTLYVPQEVAAIKARRGIWASTAHGCYPTPPWVHRAIRGGD